MMKQLKIMIAVLLVTAGLHGCTAKTETKPETVQRIHGDTVTLTHAQFQNAGIQIGTIGRATIGNQLRLSGTVDVPPESSATISAPMGGYIKKINLLPGSPVSRGQVVALLENPEFIKLQQEYLTAKAKRDFAQKDLERQKSLNEGKAASDKVYQQAQAEYSTQTAIMQSVARQLELVNINAAAISPTRIVKVSPLLSPISGIVHTVNANLGKYVNPSDVVIGVTNSSDPHLVLKVFEKDALLLHVGQKLEAFSNNYPNLKYPARIMLIDKTLDSDRSALVHCHFLQTDKSLLPGLFMTGIVEVASTTTDTLPEDAIVTWEEKLYVFIETGEKTYTMQPVETGANDNGNYSVKNANGLSGKKIVMKGAYALLMQLKNVSDE